MKQSPFKFGQVVTGEGFTNREAEIERLHNNFRSTQNTVIISPRRYGKSSLVSEAYNRFENNRNQYIFCFIDMMYVYSETEFYNQFATKVFKAASTRLEDFLQQAKKMINGARIGINTGTGEPGFEFGIDFIREHRDTILELPQRMAEKKRKKVIICIDEFQNVSRISDDNHLEGRLRAVWQHHQDAGYLLYGSKQTMMAEIFSEPSSPFFRFGDLIYLKRIETGKLREFIKENFKKSGKVISTTLCDKIIESVENHPYYLQQFARNVWLISSKIVTDNDFSRAKESLISENQNFYSEVLDELTNYQVSFLRALLNQEEQLYSMDTIYKYKLGSSANVRIMYKAFQNKGIITKENDRIVFADPVFKLIASEKLL